MNDFIELHALYHHGIKGQKWGIRRFQNNDGTLTDEGIKRYGVDASGRMSERGRLLYDSDIKRQEERTKTKRNVVLVGAVTAAVAITAGLLWYRSKIKRKALASKAGKASAAAKAKRKAAGEVFIKGVFKGSIKKPK